jgi:hypothetical protein
LGYLEGLQLAFEGGRVGAEAVAGLVHSIKILIKQSYLFAFDAGRERRGMQKKRGRRYSNQRQL